jgi:hypothetical protein
MVSPIIQEVSTEKIIIQENSLSAISEPYYFNVKPPKINFTDKGEVEYLLNQEYPEFTNLLMDLIGCESGFDPTKCGDNGKSCGILQFQEKTFLDNCEGEWLDSYDQIRCSVKLIKSGIGSTEGGWYNCWRIKNLFKYDY